MERRGGAVTGVYSYGNALVARNGEVVLSDGLGTTRATVNGVQAITSTLTTEAFGNAVAQWGSSANPYRFAGAWGYRDDGDAGLLHVGALLRAGSRQVDERGQVAGGYLSPAVVEPVPLL